MQFPSRPERTGARLPAETLLSASLLAVFRGFSRCIPGGSGRRRLFIWTRPGGLARTQLSQPERMAHSAALINRGFSFDVEVCHLPRRRGDVPLFLSPSDRSYQSTRVMASCS